VAAPNDERVAAREPIPTPEGPAPKVSVIIPVHNAGPHLRECIDSILNQTLTSIEVLCVDDGSTDDSAEILKAAAHADSRLTVLHQENSGAGRARNCGMQVARGEYLSFLDADDFFEPAMLAKAYEKCVADEADIGIYRARYFEADTGRFAPAEGLLNTDLLPDVVPFSRRDIPDHILDFVSPATWNKLFRASFVRANNLRFLETRRANDLFFTKLALACADRITFIDEVLVNYRVGTESNLQSNNDQAPFEFYESLSTLKKELVRAGLFEQVERSFTNMALSACLYNLHSLKTPESFNALFYKLRDEYFAELGVDARGRDYIYSEHRYDEYLSIRAMEPEAYLIRELAVIRAQRDVARARLEARTKRLDRAEAVLGPVRASLVYRVAQKIRRLGTGSGSSG
jgi:glycosyltransferase involved in cell wall biosynthesis